MSDRKRAGILISGRGSNMMALAGAARDPGYPAEIAVVISNRPDAAGLAWAAANGLPSVSIDHKAFATRPAFEEEMHAALVAHGAEIVACCGFMRLMTPDFVDVWRDRMINIHPSLLPAYKGLHTHERALADGVQIAGCTVHVVRLEMDVGPIIAQAAVPVLAGDTADTLSARVLAAEHILYPHALALFASGRARVEGEVVRIAGGATAPPALIWPPVELTSC
jgi:phosphoribosylglycinamide formyltransferase 1